MKRLLVAIIVVMAVCAASAQESKTTTPAPQAAKAKSSPASGEVQAVAKTDLLVPFSSIKVDAPVNIIFKKVANNDGLSISYDTKGDVDSKFRFEVDRKGTLVITEKSDSKRLTVTDVVVSYNSLKWVKIAHAKAEFESEIETSLFDIAISGGAMVTLNVKTLDVAVECTGSSRLTLGGSTKYLTMKASTAKINCSDLSTVSATIEASHSAEVRLSVSERLEVTATTGARLLYKGKPSILRNHDVVFGGEVINID